MELAEVKGGSPNIQGIRGIGSMVLVLPIHNMVTDRAQKVIVHPNLIITYVDVEPIGVCIDWMSRVAFSGSRNCTIGFAHIA